MYRVLMIAPTPFFSDRGCHVRILGEIRALQRRGCEVTLCTYHNGRDIEGIRTVRIPRVGWYNKLEAGPSNHKYYLDLMLLLRTLTLGWRERPDVVHAHLHEGAFIGRFIASVLQRPLVFDYQGSLTEELLDHDYLRKRGGGGYRFLHALEMRIDRSVGWVVPSTSRAARRLEERLGPARVTTIPDGVDTSRFTPLPEVERGKVRRRWGLPEDAVLALYVGVLTPYQGIDLLLEHTERALAAAPRLRLAIAGFPEEEYRARANEMGLGDRVTFLGRVPFEDTPALTAAADIALAPKISTSEGNLKIYNYLACGLPVVAFDNPVNHEILRDVGIYVPQGDGAAYAGALADLANDAARRRRLSRDGRRLAEEELSWDRAAAQLLEVYVAVGAGPGRPDVRVLTPPESLPAEVAIGSAGGEPHERLPDSRSLGG